ncbi:M24 family metallopeptidase [Roseovarius indicus]|uniref:M24 family metallopeptidase n=1 Tax=Roseovarius indicus TaxID=540747 RepID=UPI00137480B0|nr:Xaa-Pro peptidase family protein [Roseovarius indicus]
MAEPKRQIDSDPWDLLPAGQSVYDDRLADLQQTIKERGLNGVLIFDPENLFWLTGYQTIGYFTFHATFVGQTGRPTIIARIVNRDLAMAHPTIGAFEAVRDTEEPVEVLAGFLDQLGAGARIGVETNTRHLSVADYQQLAVLSECQLESWGGEIEARRVVKSDWELDCMQRAARAAEAGLRAAIDAVRPGCTENDIAAAMFEANIRAGSEYLGHPPLVVSGPATSLCFAMWRRREVRRGDVVLLEGAGCVNRLHAMLSRPVVVGPPTDEQLEAADALKGVLEAAIGAMKPGQSLRYQNKRLVRKTLKTTRFEGSAERIEHASCCSKIFGGARDHVPSHAGPEPRIEANMASIACWISG